ncbi:MAG: hypothetical protein RMK91_08020 [Pseudanabaenaceae cyanobacterium SKYGB_i_bin29]|nr:hypothetical protein [Pseudanabaenaceae cyanobacterium SKYG29]MDW8421800.1 hypothetical protein [Pseudanabaenaceae cyanobacterium SKYGB_i_bin29]
MIMTIPHNEARRYLRFPPDPTDVAFLDFTVWRDKFTAELAAVVVDVAPKGGCSLVFRLPKDLQIVEGQRCRIKVGDMTPLIAELVWKKEIDKDIYRCGFMFLN